MATAKGLALSSLLNINSSRTVTVNALLSGDENEIISRTKELYDNGYRAFKLKIGNRLLDDDIKIIKTVREIISTDSCLRLDANRSYSYDQAISLFEHTKDFNIDYFEEPFKSISDLKKYLNNHANSTIAVDESLREISFDRIDCLSNAKAFILKPTMLGFLKTMEYARYALEKNIIPVISSSFESAFGILTLASIAAVINADKYDIPVGLDTLDWFDENSLNVSDIIVDGKINLARFASPSEILNLQLLDEVTGG